MKFLINLVKGRDLFGNPITLSFNREGSSNTLVGGMLSMCLEGLVLYLMIHKMIHMFENQLDVFSESDGVTD